MRTNAVNQSLLLLEQLDLSYFHIEIFFLIFLRSESPSSKHLSTNYSTVPQLIFQSSNVCTVYVWILNTYIQSTAYNDTFILDNLLTVKFWLSIKLWLSNFKSSLLSEAHPSVFSLHFTWCLIQYCFHFTTTTLIVTACQEQWLSCLYAFVLSTRTSGVS
jgi:hypothetical protein